MRGSQYASKRDNLTTETPWNAVTLLGEVDESECLSAGPDKRFPVETDCITQYDPRVEVKWVLELQWKL